MNKINLMVILGLLYGSAFTILRDRSIPCGRGLEWRRSKRLRQEFYLSEFFAVEIGNSQSLMPHLPDQER